MTHKNARVINPQSLFKTLNIVTLLQGPAQIKDKIETIQRSNTLDGIPGVINPFLR